MLAYKITTWQIERLTEEVSVIYVTFVKKPNIRTSNIRVVVV